MRAKTITLDMITDDVSKRFTSKYEESDDCWLWLAGKTVGYGVITIKARGVMLRGKGVKLPRLAQSPQLDALRIAQLNSLVNKYKK